MKSKQVILVRRDLRNVKGEKVRTGKILAQACHASLAAYKQAVKTDSAFRDWDEGIFTKIVLAVNSEQELLDLAIKARAAGLNVALIEDIGLTEFGGVATKTCLAIGPHWDTQIDAVTGHLSGF